MGLSQSYSSVSLSDPSPYETSSGQPYDGQGEIRVSDLLVNLEGNVIQLFVNSEQKRASRRFNYKTVFLGDDSVLILTDKNEYYYVNVADSTLVSFKTKDSLHITHYWTVDKGSIGVSATCVYIFRDKSVCVLPRTNLEFSPDEWMKFSELSREECVSMGRSLRKL